MLRAMIYRLKRLVHGSPRLYRAIYGIVSFNFDYFRQCLQHGKYPSKFGGMWTDRDDFAVRLNARIRSGETNDSDVSGLRSWREQGFVRLDQAVDHSLIDQYLAELEGLKNQAQAPLLITAASAPDPVPYSAESSRAHHSVRVVDDYENSGHP